MKTLLLAALLPCCLSAVVTYTVTAIQYQGTPALAYAISDNGQNLALYINHEGLVSVNGAITPVGSPVNLPGVSSNGNIAGEFQGQTYIAFEGTAAGVTDLVNPFGNYGAGALGVDNAGDATGYASDSSGYNHAIVWLANGGYVDLSSFIPNPIGGNAVAVSDNGYVTGNLQSSTLGQIGFLYNISTGQFTQLAQPGQGVSDTGDVAGVFGSLYLGGSTVSVGGTVNAVNGSGDAVIELYNGSADHAFVYSNGVTTDLNSLLATNLNTLLGGSGWYLYDPAGISDNGVIVAAAEDGNGDVRSLLLTPVNSSAAPEPAGFLQMACGILVIAGLLRLRSFEHAGC